AGGALLGATAGAGVLRTLVRQLPPDRTDARRARSGIRWAGALRDGERRGGAGSAGAVRCDVDPDDRRPRARWLHGYVDRRGTHRDGAPVSVRAGGRSRSLSRHAWSARRLAVLRAGGGLPAVAGRRARDGRRVRGPLPRRLDPIQPPR